jgi:hypothetical protein
VRRFRSGVVSVVLVNYKGTDDTLTSISALRDTDWPSDRLEIIVVENGSGEEYAIPLRESSLDFRLIETGENLGFTGGCNRGVEDATGEYVAFLNNDARPDRSWIRAAVETFEADAAVGAVASKVLDWEGVNVDFTEAAVTWYGMGYKPHAGTPDTGEWAVERDVLFGTGAAMFIRAELFNELGGFDDRYFMFYDDVDLGWRLNLLGWKVRYQPASIAYHKHHASMKGFGPFRETYLLERNALFTLYKNLGDSELDRVLPGAIALAVRRAVARGELDSTQLDLRRTGDDANKDTPVDKMTMAGVFAIDQFVEQLPSLNQSRQSIQRSRRRSDRDLRELFGKVDEPAYPIADYLDGYARILNALDPAAFHRRRRILLIADAAETGAASDRDLLIARRLTADHDVRLVGLDFAPEPSGAYATARVSASAPDELSAHEEWAQVCIVPIGIIDRFPALTSSTKPLVLNITDDYLRVDALRDLDEEILARLVGDTDFVIVDSEERRRWWTAVLLASGRTSRSVLSGDPAASRVGVIPHPTSHGSVDSTLRMATAATILWDGAPHNPTLAALVREAVALAGPDRVSLTTDDAVPTAHAMIVDAADEIGSVVGATDRLLRAIESRVPLIAIGSGPLARLVRTEQIGVAVDSAETLAQALESTFDPAQRASWGANLTGLQAGLEDSAGLSSLTQFCLRPTRAGQSTDSPVLPTRQEAATSTRLGSESSPAPSAARSIYRRYVPSAARQRISRWRSR